MSIASKCDRCGELFEDQPGVVTIINVALSNGTEGGEQWSELEFCRKCSEPLLAHIRPALDYRDAHPV